MICFSCGQESPPDARYCSACGVLLAAGPFARSDENASLNVFFSYASKDQALRDKLEDHLSNLKYQGLISTWHAQEISAGEEHFRQIDIHLESAHIILLLITASFMASTYCYSREMRRALERHKRGEAQVVPILLRPVDYSKAPFARLEILPTNGKPVTSWRDRERAFVDIALALERLALILLPRILPKRMIENEVPPATVRETLYQQYEPTIIPARAPDFNIPHAPIGLAEQLQKEGTPVTAPGHAGTPVTAPGYTGTPVTAPGAEIPVTAPGYAGTPVTVPGYAETPVITPGSSHAGQRFRRQVSSWTPTLVYLVGLFCILFLIYNNPNLLQFLNGFFVRLPGPLATVLGFIVGGIITILYSFLFVKASAAYRKLKELVRRRKEQKQAIRVREELLRIEEANRRAEADRIREETFRKHAEEARQQEQEAAREEAYVRLYYLEALKAYEQALLSNNGDAIAYRGKGNALAGLGRLDEAIQAFERANELAPRASNAMSIGNVFARLRQFEKAIIAYKQAIELDNKFVLDFHEMSETLQQQGDAEAAQRIDEYAKQHGYHD